MRETDVEKARARERNLRWMEALWEGTSTSAKEEDQKEEILAVFRDLARESRYERDVREYVPWQPLWWQQALRPLHDLVLTVALLRRAA